jgi:two-component system chemotaxis response regulator CheB
VDIVRQKIKVLIVDDTSFMRKALLDIISKDEDIEVVGVAKNGQDAIEAVETLKPDVITMDVDMPVMDGLTALKHIMIKNPTPIIMISGLASQGSVTLDALRLGAVDFFPKPSGTISLDIHSVGNKLSEIIKNASKISPQNIQRVCFTYNPKFCLSRQVKIEKPPEGILFVIAHRYTSSLLLRLLGNLRPGLPIAVVAIHDINKEVVDSYALEMNSVLPWSVFTEPGNKLYVGRCLLSSFTNIPCLSYENNMFTVSENCHYDDITAMFSEVLKVKQSNCLAVVFGNPDEKTANAISFFKDNKIDCYFFNPEDDLPEQYLQLFEKMPSEQYIWAKVEIFGTSFIIDPTKRNQTSQEDATND